MKPCHACGSVYDYDSVPNNPHKRCPTCKVPLDEEAVEHTFHEAQNPSDRNDGQRAKNREQMLADIDGATSFSPTRSGFKGF